VKNIDWSAVFLCVLVLSMAGCEAVSEYAHARYGYGNCQHSDDK